MDIDERTPKELSGINDREDIMKYLDSVAAKLETQEKKKAKSMKERAKKDAEKRIKVKLYLCMFFFIAISRNCWRKLFEFESCI